jgi:hypothetical protein
MISDHRTMNSQEKRGRNLSFCIEGLKDEILNQVQDDCQISENDHKRRDDLMGRIEQQFRASEKLDAVTNKINRGVSEYMGRIEHITTQQIIGEWGSINNFASSHGISPASTKMVIYVDGAKSRPVEEALRKYGYLNLLHFEKELRKRGQTFSDYLAEDGLNPVELIETLRMKEIHPAVLLGLKQRGYWGALETKRRLDVSKGSVRKRSKRGN